MCVVSWTPPCTSRTCLSFLLHPPGLSFGLLSLPFSLVASLCSTPQTLAVVLDAQSPVCRQPCQDPQTLPGMFYTPTSPIMHCAFEFIPFSCSSSQADPRRRSRRDFAKPAVLKATCSASQAAYPPARLCCFPFSSAAGQSSARSICWSLFSNRPPDHCQAPRRTSRARGFGSQLASRPPALLAKC